MQLNHMHKPSRGIILLLSLALSSQLSRAAELQDGLTALNHGNVTKAVAIWVPLAEQGEVVAQQMLGAVYSKPISNLRWRANYAKSAYWYQKCEPKSALCVYGLAELYYEGHGVQYDRARAANLYRRFVSSGTDYTEGVNAARVKLGLIYKLGDGVTIDQAEARKFFSAAADEGNSEAQFWLGKICEDPAPPSVVDRVQANKWYLLAMKNPDKAPFAQSESERLERSMSRQEIAQSRSLAVTWKPK
jgi:TPR repeat protein